MVCIYRAYNTYIAVLIYVMLSYWASWSRGCIGISASIVVVLSGGRKPLITWVGSSGCQHTVVSRWEVMSVGSRVGQHGRLHLRVGRLLGGLQGLQSRLSSWGSRVRAWQECYRSGLAGVSTCSGNVWIVCGIPSIVHRNLTACLGWWRGCISAGTSRSSLLCCAAKTNNNYNDYNSKWATDAQEDTSDTHCNSSNSSYATTATRCTRLDTDRGDTYVHRVREGNESARGTCPMQTMWLLHRWKFITAGQYQVRYICVYHNTYIWCCNTYIYCRYCNLAKYILINTKQCKNIAGCMFCKCNWEVGSIPVMY